MNCKTCDYPLWNIEKRQCPECGSPFKPTDYTFALNSVRFCCPGCKQAYYGTSDIGLLVPGEFDCVTCARHLTTDEMILLPAAGVAEQITRGDTLPWLERRRVGRFRAWFATFSRVLSDPAKVIALLPVERPGSEALTYAISHFVLFFTANLGVFFLSSQVRSIIGPTASHGLGAIGTVLTALCVLPLLIAIMIFFQAGVAHFVLVLSGGAPQPFRRTVQCVCFSAPTAFLSAIPCIGYAFSPVALIWWYIASGQMIAAGHKVKAWRAALAVSVGPLLIIAFAVLAFFLLNDVRVSPLGISVTPNSPAAPVTNRQADRVAHAIHGYTGEHGQPPRHASMLAIHDPLALGALFPRTDIAKGMLGGIPFDTLARMKPEELERATESMATQIPAGTAAYRAGDFVFLLPNTALKENSNVDNDDLWVAILPSRVAGSGEVAVIKRDSEVDRFPATEFDKRIKEQNELRTSLGWPSLPDAANMPK